MGVSCSRSHNDASADIRLSRALVMFPTKALAQDQLTKLEAILKRHPNMQQSIRPGIIDGDTPMTMRSHIADRCNIILTNPDTLHAANLPGWKANYSRMLANLHYLVIDEFHTYEGAFGAHVSLVLSRLSRLVRVANHTADHSVASMSNADTSPAKTASGMVFIGCSATIGHPEEHFRLICPIGKHEEVRVLTAEEDGSPCAAKVRVLFGTTTEQTREFAKNFTLGALTKFKSGRRDILICTDLASRGLDIPSVDVVINFDLPGHGKDYIHWVGRTARAGRSGKAVAMVKQYDVEVYQRLEALLGKKLPEYKLDEETVLVLHEQVSGVSC